MGIPVRLLRAGMLCLGICCTAAHAQNIAPGMPMPAFTVCSGDSDTLHSSSLQRTVIVITYETKETADDNKHFKDLVLRYYAADPARKQAVALVPVVNCSAYLWPIRKFCIKNVRKNSQKMAITLYDDRDGGMFDSFCMQDDCSNVIIVDRHGIIRFVHRGKMTEDQSASAFALIRQLVEE